MRQGRVALNLPALASRVLRLQVLATSHYSQPGVVFKTRAVVELILRILIEIQMRLGIELSSRTIYEVQIQT